MNAACASTSRYANPSMDSSQNNLQTSMLTSLTIARCAMVPTVRVKLFGFLVHSIDMLSKPTLASAIPTSRIIATVTAGCLSWQRTSCTVRGMRIRILTLHCTALLTLKLSIVRPTISRTHKGRLCTFKLRRLGYVVSGFVVYGPQIPR